LDFRASVSFLVNQESHVNLPLRTNPVFIVPPRCYPSNPAGHAMHARQVEYYQVEVWPVDRLTAKNDSPSSYINDTIIFIDATSDGTKTLARAWCLTHGRNAAVRPRRGLCYKCAVLATRRLKLDVLVWCREV
jgi:hypothetical protein